MRTEIYKTAKYYEIAFNFVDIKKQVSLFQKFISEYGKIPVKTVLDIACGPGLQLREFARRGYGCIGVDLSPEMLEYLKQRSAADKLDIETREAPLADFDLSKKADFAYIMMGSIAYVKNNGEFVNHLRSLARNLNSGGLYIIENLAMTWGGPKIWEAQTWKMEKDGIKVDATYKLSLKDELAQIVEQTIRLDVDDNGKKISLEDKDDLKIIMPQEFKTVVELIGDFEFVGFFERWSTARLAAAAPNNLIVLRKK